MVTLTHTPYGGWENCFTLANGQIELVVTADVGPRIIHLARVGGENLFYRDLDASGRTGGDEWRIYGGHRLWHAPESKPRTYSPDNAPVTVEPIADGVRLTQPVEPETGIEKQIELVMHPEAGHVRVTHRLKNTGLWDVSFAPWALSVMAMGGTAFFPIPPRGQHSTHLLPASTLTLWAYTHMNDPRWTWGTRYVLLRSQPGAQPQKIGARVPEGWAGYAHPDGLFLKFFDHDPAATYADMDCNCELFTNEVILEVESLGALTTIAPGATVTHIEDWHVFAPVPAPARDLDVETQIMPRVHEAQALNGR